MSTQVMPKQAEGFQSEELDGEYLIFRLGMHRAIHLNQTAGIVWRLCDGTRSAGEISQLLATEYPADSAQDISRDVSEIIGRLTEIGVLHPA